MTFTRDEHIWALKFSEMAHTGTDVARRCRQLINIYETLSDEKFNQVSASIEIRVPGAAMRQRPITATRG